MTGVTKAVVCVILSVGWCSKGYVVIGILTIQVPCSDWSGSFTNGVTKSVVSAILYVGWCIYNIPDFFGKMSEPQVDMGMLIVLPAGKRSP